MPVPNYTLVQLRYFLAAVDEGSMTAASQRMRVAQSAISTAVAHLENELGVQLAIRRHASGLTLTRSGESFVAELRRFLVHADELTEAARGLGESLVGDLYIEFFSTISPFYLPRLLTGFEAQYPHVRVFVQEDEHAHIVSRLRSGQCEIALMYGYGLHDEMNFEVVDSVDPHVIVAAGHPLSQAEGVSLSDLIDEPMVLLDLPHSREYFQDLLTSLQLEPNLGRTSTSYETVRSLVAHGHGWSILNQKPRLDVTYDGKEL